MNKKEVAEIKKLFKPEMCNLTRICGCYVDSEKQKVSETKEAFLSIPEEEMFKYFDVFKKNLSGKIGKNLLNLKYETSTYLPGQDLLLGLKDSKLTDDSLIEEFFDKIISSYYYVGNYYIILAHGIYDIPGKASDGATMYDASDEVYEYLICSICPVDLAKPGLSYQTENSRFEERTRDWVMGMPMHGFLWPSFSDRTENIHEALLYTKKTADIQEDFITNSLGTMIPQTSDEQEQAFKDLFSSAKNVSFEQIQSIREEISELEEAQDTPVELDPVSLKKIFEKNEITLSEPPKSTLLSSNISGSTKVKTVAATLTTDEPLDIKTIDGKKYIILPVEGAEINGIPVNQ